MVGPARNRSWTDRFLYELVLPGFEPCRFNCPPGSRRQIPVAAPLIINPGSEQIRYTAERDGTSEISSKLARQLWPTPAVRVSGNGNGIPTTIRAKTPSLPPLTVISPNEQTATRTRMPLLLPRTDARADHRRRPLFQPADRYTENRRRPRSETERNRKAPTSRRKDSK